MSRRERDNRGAPEDTRVNRNGPRQGFTAAPSYSLYRNTGLLARPSSPCSFSKASLEGKKLRLPQPDGEAAGRPSLGDDPPSSDTDRFQLGAGLLCSKHRSSGERAQPRTPLLPPEAGAPASSSPDGRRTDRRRQPLRPGPEAAHRRRPPLSVIMQPPVFPPVLAGSGLGPAKPRPRPGRARRHPPPPPSRPGPPTTRAPAHRGRRYPLPTGGRKKRAHAGPDGGSGSFPLSQRQRPPATAPRRAVPCRAVPYRTAPPPLLRSTSLPHPGPPLSSRGPRARPTQPLCRCCCRGLAPANGRAASPRPAPPPVPQQGTRPP